MEHIEESTVELNSKSGIHGIDPAQMCQQLPRLSFLKLSTVQLVQACCCRQVKVKVTMQHSGMILPIENTKSKIMETVQGAEQK